MANRTDTFNRANTNAGLGTPSDSGSAWIDAGGYYGIASNQAYLDGTRGNNIQLLETSEADGAIQFTINAFSGGGTPTQAAYIIARYADANNFIRIQCEGDAFVMYQNVAGVETAAGSPSFRLCTITAGSVVKLTMTGTTFALFLDGVQQGGTFTVSNAAFDTATKHGFVIIQPASAVLIDDFTFTGSGGGGGATSGSRMGLLGVGN